jgi:hypothetical protein
MAAEEFETMAELRTHLVTSHDEEQTFVDARDTFTTDGHFRGFLWWRHDGHHAHEGRVFDEFAPTIDGEEPPG